MAPRHCPGVHLAQSSLWLVVARVVATLDVKPKVVNGVPVELNVKEKNAFFRWVHPEYWVEKWISHQINSTDRILDGLECDVTPRAHVDLDQLCMM